MISNGRASVTFLVAGEPKMHGGGVAVWLLRKQHTSLLLNCRSASRHSSSDGSRGTMRTATDANWRPIWVYMGGSVV